VSWRLRELDDFALPATNRPALGSRSANGKREQPRCRPGLKPSKPRRRTPGDDLADLDLPPGSSPIKLLVEQSELLRIASPPCWSPAELPTNDPLRPAAASLRGTNSRAWSASVASSVSCTARCPGAVKRAGNARALHACCWRRKANGGAAAEPSSNQSSRCLHQHGNPHHTCSPISTKERPCVFKELYYNERTHRPPRPARCAGPG